MDDAGKGQTKHPDEEDALQVVQGEGKALLYFGMLNEISVIILKRQCHEIIL